MIFWDFQKDKSPVISLVGEQVTRDLGQHGTDGGVVQSQTVTVEFMNQTADKMVVTGWRTSCGCMKVLPETAEVLSGERLIVEITIDMKSGGLKQVSLQPKLLHSNNPSQVHLAYYVESTSKISVTSSSVTLEEDGRGVLNLICVSPFLPTVELLITTSGGLNSIFSGWTEITTPTNPQESEGAIWMSTVEIFGKATDASWVQINTKNQRIGRFPVKNKS